MRSESFGRKLSLSFEKALKLYNKTINIDIPNGLLFLVVFEFPRDSVALWLNSVEDAAK